jgi:large subunit ribosomal protein L16
MLEPSRLKHRKQQRGRLKGNANRGTRISFGDFGIKTLEKGRITSRQIEAARVAANRKLERAGKVWVRIFPDKPVTQKPAETRMGKGKGSPEFFVAPVKPGRMLFEVGGGAPRALGQEALRLAKHKLPVKTKFVERPGYEETDENQ